MARTTSTTETPDEAPETVDTHQVQDTPTGGAVRSANAPGVRTEPEVVAASAAAAKRAGKTPVGDPSVEPVRLLQATVADDPTKVVKFTRADGGEFEAAQGSAAHLKMLRDPDFTAA